MLADDLLQQTFLRLVERGASLRADSNLRAWLFTVARNATASLMRSIFVLEDTDALEELACPSPDLARARLVPRRMTRLWTAVLCLSVISNLIWALSFSAQLLGAK